MPVRYGPLNKMVMKASINGHPANLIVDTGANQSILDSEIAEASGVNTGRHGLRMTQFTQVNGRDLRIGFVNSFRVGGSDLGGISVAIQPNRRSTYSIHSPTGDLNVDGLLGTDILGRYKAVINCRTKLIFFKISSSRPLQLARVTSAQRFIKVPLREESNHALTVPCSMNGRPGRLLVDTGAFITTLDESAVKSLGVQLQPTKATARFSDGMARQISLGQMNHFTVGNFKVPPQKIGAANLPAFALQQGDTRIDGILGMELLALCHGIIDLDGMSLFLK